MLQLTFLEYSSSINACISVFSQLCFFLSPPLLNCRYAEIGHIAHKALQEFCSEVERGEFPSKEYSPYSMSASERELLTSHLRRRGHGDEAETLVDFRVK